ncbi:hypothetical protein J2X97_000736 [Epilithonimonas hungarica]|uniref:hypothetical protein n=1 Tax=Epilithonimonas hungarica TaxID=454006 RepID=UPI002788B2D3|nr:hypothetical protein [Epilithonimonas hungarica]MDP9955099.1 hypothetical protein [Epilithonimonas hungarica]
MKIGSKEFYKPVPQDEIFGNSLTKMSDFTQSIVKYLLIPKSKQNLVSAYNNDEVKMILLPTFGLDFHNIMKEHGR